VSKWAFVGFSFLGFFAITCAAVLVYSLWINPHSCSAEIAPVSSGRPALQQVPQTPSPATSGGARQIIVIHGNDEQIVIVPAMPARYTRVQAAVR
jgi:hypothetical protein